MSGRVRNLLLACGFGPTLFVVVLLIESLTRSHYDPLHHFGSELANGDRGWVMITGFVVAGVATLAFAAGLHQTWKPGNASVIAPALVTLFGAGLVVAGIFVADPKPGYPLGSTGTAEPTLAGLIHDGNLIPTWIAMTAAMAAVAWRFTTIRRERAWAWYTIATAVVSLTTLLIAVQLYNHDTQTGSWHGLWQRISITVGFVWFGALAVHVRRSAPRDTAPTA